MNVVVVRRFVAVAAISCFLSALPAKLNAQETRTEKAGVAVGLTVGNLVFVPAKAVSAVFGALSGALSFLVTGGDTEVAGQVWRDTFSEPYYISPELAKKSIGQRPLLIEQKESGMKPASVETDTMPPQ